MNLHKTKYIGDVATAKVMAHLIENRWYILTPVVSENLPFDLLAYREVEGKAEYIRIQVKASPTFSLGFKKLDGSKRDTPKYSAKNIDLFASYIEEHDCCVFVPVSMVEKLKVVDINCTLPNSATRFFWFEDFKTISVKEREKKSFKDFGYNLSRPGSALSQKLHADYPEPKEFQRLLWTKGMQRLTADLGVSDTAVRKHASRLGLLFPPQGYANASKEKRREILERYKPALAAKMKTL